MSKRTLFAQLIHDDEHPEVADIICKKHRQAARDELNDDMNKALEKHMNAMHELAGSDHEWIGEDEATEIFIMFAWLGKLDKWKDEDGTEHTKVSMRDFLNILDIWSERAYTEYVGNDDHLYKMDKEVA